MTIMLLSLEVAEVETIGVTANIAAKISSDFRENIDKKDHRRLLW